MLVSNITEVPAMLALIVRSAFGLDQAAGGVTSQPRPCRCRPIPTGAVVRRVRRHAFGDRDPTFIAVVLFFIAGTSISGNDAKSESAVHYLRGGRASILLPRLGSLAMVAGGAFARLDIVWDTADAAMGMMATVDPVAVALLSGVAIKLTPDCDRKIRAGDASPRLDAADFPELGDAIDRSIWSAEKTVAPLAKQA